MPRKATRRFRLYRFTLAQFLRTVGLDAISFIRRKTRPNDVEEAKIAISDSTLVALIRSSIHVLPVAVSIYLITLNLRGYYVGQHLPWSEDNYGDSVALAFIQVAAKIQELLVVASIGVVIFHTTIDALTNEYGVPLGLCSSGFSFVKISYFWSSAFWGGTLRLWKAPNQRLIVLYACTVLGGVVGLTAGPASAVLMLPRSATWQQFSTMYWMNGTANDFWPDILKAEHLGEPQSCREGFVSSGCASVGLPLLLTYDYYNRNDEGGFQIFTPDSSLPRIIDGTPKVKDISVESWTIAPHAATSRALTRLWGSPQWVAEGDVTGTESGQANAEAAVVRTVCSADVVMTTNRTSEVSLPDLPAFATWTENGNSGDLRSIKLHEPLWVQANDTGAGRNYLTTVFVTPDPDMTSVTTGVVILGPLKNQKRAAMVCSIDARWNHAQHNMIKSSDYGIGNPGNPVYAVLRSRNPQVDLKNMTLPVNDGSSWKHVSADRSWLKGALGFPAPFNNPLSTILQGY